MTELRRVLCVDDNEADQFLNRLRITEYDSTIDLLTVSSGEEALRVIRDGDFAADLVLLDINMPGMNGFDFLEIYESEIPAASRCPVVILSTSDWDSEGRSPGDFPSVRGQLRKPLTERWYTEVASMLAS